MAGEFRRSPKTNGALNQYSVGDDGLETDANGNVPIYDEQGNVVGYAPPSRGRAPGAPVNAVDQIKDEAVKQGLKEAQNYGKDVIKDIWKGEGAAQAVAQGNGAASGLAGAAAENGSFWGGNAVAIPESSFFTGNGLLNEGAMGTGDYLPGVAGAVGLYDLYQNNPEKIGTGEGYLQGAASGAGVGYTVGGPWGAAIGAGAGLVANALGIGGESRTKGEEKKREALAAQGIAIPNQDVKEWENNEVFKQSRNEADLTGKDIIHAADFYGINGYANLDAAKQEAVASEALKQGLIREQLGKVTLNMTPEYQKYLESTIGNPTSGGNSSGGDRRRIEAENKKQRKRAALESIMPDIMSTPTQAPRYDQNPGALITNPYL